MDMAKVRKRGKVVLSDSDEEYDKPQQKAKAAKRKKMKISLDENDDEAEKQEQRAAAPSDEPDPKRRRKAAAPPITAVSGTQSSQANKQVYDPAELKALYAGWMESASNGKITAKNTWTMNLIDYLDEVQDVMDAPAEPNIAQTNFQKASVTLDASIKIYSTRVDSVHTDTYKMLGGLSRSKADKEKAGLNSAQDGDENSDDQEGAVKAKRTTHKPNAPVVTLETNLAAINMKRLDKEFFVDPLFRKTSASFDQAGARSFLLSQLHVCNGCEIVFDSGDERVGEKKNYVDSPLDLGALRAQAQNLCKDLSNLEIDPVYKNFKFSDAAQRLDHIQAGSDGEDSDDDIHHDGWDQPLEERKLAENLEAAVLPTVGVFAMDQPIEMPPDNYDDDYSQPIAYDLPDDDDDHEPRVQEEEHRFDMALKMIGKADGNDYNYFNEKLFETWTGPAHWRFKKITEAKGPKETKATEGDADQANAKPEKKTTKKRKPQFMIDFSTPTKKQRTEIAKLLEPAAKSSITFSVAKLNEQLKAAGNQMVPLDVKFDPVSFTQLFNQPKWKLPNLAARQEAEPEEEEEHHYQGGAGEWMIPDDGDDDPPLDQMDDGGDDEPVYNFDPQPVGVGGALNLLPMPERPEKINVKFATNATFVDVKALKNKLWKHISTDPRSDPNSPNKKKPQKFQSFRSMVVSTNNSIPPQVRESVSVPYYFICLLHLANEHNLEIKQDKHSDLKILIPTN